MARTYSFDDERFIEDNAQVMTTAQLAAHFGVSVEAICIKAGRMGVSLKKQGENHYRCKVSNDDIRLIKLLIADGEIKLRAIDRLFDLYPGTACKVKNGKLYKQVSLES